MLLKIFYSSTLIINTVYVTLVNSKDIHSSREAQRICAVAYNITPAEMALYHDPDIDLNDFANNYKLKCFANCFLEYGQLMENGKFMYAATRARLEMQFPMNTPIRSAFIEMLDKCQNVTDNIENACEAAYQLESCFARASKILKA